MADNISVNTGTAATIRTDDVGGVQYPVVKIDVGADGASSAFTGTLGAVTNLAAGTLTRLTAGTLTALGLGTITTGTFNRGTVQTIGTSIRHVAEFATAVTLTGTATGTLQAAVSGSVHYVTSLIVSVESSGRMAIASGTPTSPIIGTMNFNANGGIAAMPINPPIRTASGSALVFNQSGTGVIGIFAGGFTE